MIKLNLKTTNKAQEQIKQYLEANVSEILADKINNGVEITKDNRTLINKKDLDGFWKFATEEARKTAEKGSSGAYVDDETVFGWSIHYFEEDSIEGTLYNEDGTEFKPALPKSNITPTTIPKQTSQKENTQASLFDLLTTESKAKEKIDLEKTTNAEEDIEEQEENLSYKAQLAKYSQQDILEDDEEFTEEEQEEALEQLHNEQDKELTQNELGLEIIENDNERVTIDTTTGEVLSKEQIENSFDKKSLFILMNYLPELEMR